MTLDVLYFAWLRERIGQPRERVETAVTDAPRASASAKASGAVATVTDRPEPRNGAVASSAPVRSSAMTTSPVICL